MLWQGVACVLHCRWKHSFRKSGTSMFRCFTDGFRSCVSSGYGVFIVHISQYLETGFGHKNSVFELG
jgi:hypothetical protein